MGVLFFIISWFIVGFLSVVGIWIYDMKGQPYDKNYFNDSFGPMFAMCCFGYITPIILLGFIIASKQEFFTKLIYKIANPGVKIEKSDED